jgi:hypothetical protein
MDDRDELKLALIYGCIALSLLFIKALFHILRRLLVCRVQGELLCKYILHIIIALRRVVIMEMSVSQ